MKTFLISKREVYAQMVKVEAETIEEAIKKVSHGEGEYIDDSLEYSHDLDQSLWTWDTMEE